MKKLTLLSAITLALLSSCEKTENVALSTHYEITEGSLVSWAGHMEGASNNGTFDIEGEGIEVSNGTITGGSFTIPIASVNVLNLGDDLKPVLEAHLQSADFFNVVLHPNAKFVIKSVKPFNGPVTGGMITGANSTVTGDFTMLGVTKTIEFPAKIMVADIGIAVQAKFKINRLNWGMNYASDPAIPEHYICPDVDINLALAAEKQ